MASNTLNMAYLKNCLFLTALLAGAHLCAQTAESRDIKARDVREETAPRSESMKEDTRSWSFIVAPYVYHWEPSPNHKEAFALALEHKDRADDTLVGFSLFRNSFGQPSAYAYWGKRWNNIWDKPDLTFKLTGGVLYGYVDQFKDRVPLNYNGFAPCIIPVLLYHLDRDQTLDVMVLGVGGLGFSYTHEF